MKPPFGVVFNWIIKVYTILVWHTISRSSNLEICCYHCLILLLIFHLKVLINFLFFFFFFFSFFIIIIIIIIISTTTTTTTTTTSFTIVVVVVLLLFIICIVNLPVVRSRSCWVIYYFDTSALGRRHQSFGCVNIHIKYIFRVSVRMTQNFFYINKISVSLT